MKRAINIVLILGILCMSAYITSYNKEISVEDNTIFKGGERVVLTNYLYESAPADGNPYSFDTTFSYTFDSLELGERDIIEVNYNVTEWSNFLDDAVQIEDGDGNYYAYLQNFSSPQFYVGRIARDFVDGTGNYTQVYSTVNGGFFNVETNENNTVEASWTDDWTIVIRIKGEKDNPFSSFSYASFFSIKIIKQSS